MFGSVQVRMRPARVGRGFYCFTLLAALGAVFGFARTWVRMSVRS